MKELKDRLKPPFERNKYLDKEKSFSLRLEQRYMAKEVTFNAIEGFVYQALNNEYRRRFGKPERWKKVYSAAGNERLVCPVCSERTMFFPAHSYCPHCGIKLLPPEGDK